MPGARPPPRDRRLGAVRLGGAAVLHADHHVRLRAVFRLGDRARSGRAGRRCGALRRRPPGFVGRAALAGARRRSRMRRGGASRGSRHSPCWSSSARRCCGSASRAMPSRHSVVLVGLCDRRRRRRVRGVFNNAMMPSLVPPERLGRLSGTGWAVGYVGGLISLIIVLGFLAANPQTGKTLLGMHAAVRARSGAARRRPRGRAADGDLVRRVHPAAVPVHARPCRAGTAARRGGVARPRTLGETLRRLPEHRNVAVFLLANMIYADGLLALFAFGGIYAAGTFGWSTIQIGIFGILLIITGDDRRLCSAAGSTTGSGRSAVILGSLLILILATVAILSTARDHVLFVVPVAPPVPAAASLPRRPSALSSRSARSSGSRPGRCRRPRARCWCGSRRPSKIDAVLRPVALSGKVTSFAGPAAGRARHHGIRQPARRHGGAGRVLRAGRAGVEPGQVKPSDRSGHPVFLALAPLAAQMPD